MDDQKSIINHSFFPSEVHERTHFEGTKYQGKSFFKKVTEIYLQAEGKEDAVEKMLKIYSRKDTL